MNYVNGNECWFGLIYNFFSYRFVHIDYNLIIT